MNPVERLRAAITLTNRFVDLVAEGNDGQVASRLPASASEIEDAASLVLAALRHPAGRETLRAVGPTARWLLAPDAARKLEQVVTLLPHCLSPEEAALRARVTPLIDDIRRGAATQRRDPEDDALMRQWFDVAFRINGEENQLLARVRCREWVGPASSSALGASKGSGCALLLFFLFLVALSGFTTIAAQASR